MRSSLDPLDPTAGLYATIGRWWQIARAVLGPLLCVGFMVWLVWAMWSFGPEVPQ